MLRVFAILTLLISMNLSADISTSEFNFCRALEGSLERLICYDNLKSKTKENRQELQLTTAKSVAPSLSLSAPELAPPAAPADTSNSTGYWQTDVEVVDPNDYSRNKATTTLIASTSNLRVDKLPILRIHCNSKKTRLSVNWGMPVGRVAKYEIYIGEEQFFSSKWRLSKNKFITYYPKMALYLLKQMIKDNQFTIAMMLSDGSIMKSSFDTSGMQNAIRPIRETCGW